MEGVSRMIMKVGWGGAKDRYSNRLEDLQRKIKKNLEKISSGMKINSAADNPAGLAISEKLRMLINQYTREVQNYQDYVSRNQTADAALGGIQDALQRMRELSVQMANGTLEDSDRDAIKAELSQLEQEINRTAETTEFNGQKIIRDMNSSALGVEDIANAAPEEAIRVVGNAINTVSSRRNDIGAETNRYISHINNLNTALENIMSAENTIRGTDIAKEIMKLTTNKILTQSTLMSMSHANLSAENVLNLFK